MLVVPKETPIDFLVRRKFPDVNQIDTAAGRLNLLSGTFINPQLEQLSLRAKEIVAYRTELETKPEEELNSLYDAEYQMEQQELEAKYALEEKQRFFHHSSANADFDHWSKAVYWTPEEATALSFGKNPKIVNWNSLKDFSCYPPSPFIEQYSKIRDLVQRAKLFKQLLEFNIPAVFIGWAKSNEIPFPQELEEKVRARGGVITNWKFAYEELKKHFDDITKKATDALGNRDKVIDELMEEIKKLQADGKAVNPKSRSSYLKMIAAMSSFNGIGYKPNSNNGAAKKISDRIILNGHELTDDAVRQHLEDAWEAFPMPEK